MTMLETPLEKIEREMREQFPTETSRLDRAVEAFEESTARLYDQQGRQIYSDEQHRERVAALLDKLDGTLGTISEAAEAAVTKAKTDLARLEGADGWEKLSDGERQKAAARQPFIAEDARDGRPDQLVKQARAAIVAGDKAAVYLWARGIRRRVDTADDQGQRVAPELTAVLRDLEATFGDPAERREQRQAIERRISSAQVLEGRVRQTRSSADGSQAAAVERQRQYMMTRW